MLCFPTSPNYSACVLPVKTLKHNNCVFSLKCCITSLPADISQLLLDFFIFSGLQLMFTLLYDSLNLVINGFSSGLMEAIAQEKGSREFSMRQLDCVTCIIRGVLTC